MEKNESLIFEGNLCYPEIGAKLFQEVPKWFISLLSQKDPVDISPFWIEGRLS